MQGLCLNVNHFPNIYNFRLTDCINGRNCYTKGSKQIGRNVQDHSCHLLYDVNILLISKTFYAKINRV